MLVGDKKDFDNENAVSPAAFSPISPSDSLGRWGSCKELKPSMAFLPVIILTSLCCTKHRVKIVEFFESFNKFGRPPGLRY